jgi:hypothetical protein
MNNNEQLPPARLIQFPAVINWAFSFGAMESLCYSLVFQLTNLLLHDFKSQGLKAHGIRAALRPLCCNIKTQLLGTKRTKNFAHHTD